MKLLLLSILLLFLANSSEAQFYTIRSTQSTKTSTPIEVKESTTLDDFQPIKPDKTNIFKQEIFQCSLPLDRELYLTSPYGYRKDPFTGKTRFHHGLDLQCDNEKVLAMFPGKVVKVGKNKGYGNYIVITHKVFEVTYGHLEYALVEKGDFVNPGTIVGISGNTGRSTGPHLHLEIKYRGKKCDPLPLLAFIDKTVKIQNKIKDNIMNEKNSSMTALAHVQEAYSEEYIAFLKEEGKTSSEESALLFLEMKEKEILTSEQEA